MDFSQLPKMSKTQQPPTPGEDVSLATPVPEAATPATRMPRYDYNPEYSFGSTWISLIAGVIFLAMGETFARWLIATLTRRPFPTGWLWEEGAPKAGQERTYFELLGGTAWTDTGMFLMGVALLLDAALMFIAYRGGLPKRSLVLLAVGLTAVAALINLGVVIYLFGLGITPLMSLVAIAVAGMILFDHAPLLRRRY